MGYFNFDVQLVYDILIIADFSAQENKSLKQIFYLQHYSFKEGYKINKSTYNTI